MEIHPSAIIAHNAVLGPGVKIGPFSIIGDHVTIGRDTVVGDHVTLGGLMASHQFVRIGAYAFISGLTGLPQDIPPYTIAAGPRARLYGLNLVGLRRHGFSRAVIDGLRKAYRIIWHESGRFDEGIARVRKEIEPFPELDVLLDFFRESKRGVTRKASGNIAEM